MTPESRARWMITEMERLAEWLESGSGRNHAAAVQVLGRRLRHEYPAIASDYLALVEPRKMAMNRESSP